MMQANTGSFINIASAAGVLSQIGDAAYSASKSAAVSLAQSLAIQFGGTGVHIGVVCPMYVATPMIGYDTEDWADTETVLSVATTVDRILEGIAERRFFISPHKDLPELFVRRAQDTERWIAGMQKLHKKMQQSRALGDLKTYVKNI